MVHEVSAALSCLFLIIHFFYGRKFLLASFFISIVTFSLLSHEIVNIDLLASDRFLGTPVVYFPIMMIGLGSLLHYLKTWGARKFYLLLRSSADKYILLFISWFLILGFYQGGFINGLPYIGGYLFLWSFYRLERVIYSDGISFNEFQIIKWAIPITIIVFLISLYLNNHDPYFVPIRYLNRNCGVMILLSLLVINYAWIVTTKWKNFLCWFCFGLTLTLIYLTQSRSGLLSTMVFIGLMLWNSRRNFTVILSLFFSLIVFSFTTFVVNNSLIRNHMEAESTIARFGSVAEQTKMTIEGKPPVKIEVSTHERIVHMKDALKVIKKKWFLGTGLGFKNYFRFVKLDIERTPHNILISYLAQMGIIGLIIFITIHLKLFGNSIAPEAKYPFIAFISALVIHLLFNEYYLQPYVWLILGIIPSLPWSRSQIIVSDTQGV